MDKNVISDYFDIIAGKPTENFDQEETDFPLQLQNKKVNGGNVKEF
jgi:hypothetical protein